MVLVIKMRYPAYGRYLLLAPHGKVVLEIMEAWAYYIWASHVCRAVGLGQA